MNGDQAALDGVFKASGWTRVATGSAPFAGSGLVAYGSPYALAGIVSVEQVADVCEHWPQRQAELAALAMADASQRGKDLYLVFLVPEVPPEVIPKLMAITDDTYTCRKICLERHGRPAAKAVTELGFLAVGRSTDLASNEGPAPAATGNLPARLLDDLVKRGAGTILDRLLEGRYRGGTRP